MAKHKALTGLAMKGLTAVLCFWCMHPLNRISLSLQAVDQTPV